jgi:hypothetical protein
MARAARYWRSTCGVTVFVAVAGLRVLVALTKVDEYDPSVAASLPRVFFSAPICTLISQVAPLRPCFARLDVQAAVICGARTPAHDLHARCNQCQVYHLCSRAVCTAQDITVRSCCHICQPVRL